ncbi:hypothetical protein [Belliella pelovolcani]|uniref:hypothetical protein n=1 Tax=Belliella pelovolcani TaxID=529505 RepID=UPI00391A355E
MKRTRYHPNEMLNSRITDTIYYDCYYEYETYIIESGGEVQYVDIYFMLDCEFVIEPDSDPGNPYSGGTPFPGGSGNPAPDYEESCYEPHPTIPNLYVLCGHMSIFDSLNDFIINRPLSLFKGIPCEVIQAWLGTATFEVKQPEIDKLNTIVSNFTYGTGTSGAIFNMQDIARLQSINNAYSTVVNMDYFPVTVSQLPTVNGQQMTPEAFLHHIRQISMDS